MKKVVDNSSHFIYDCGRCLDLSGNERRWVLKKWGISHLKSKLKLQEMLLFSLLSHFLLLWVLYFSLYCPLFLNFFFTSLFHSLFYSKEWNAICRSRDAEQVAFFLLSSHFLRLSSPLVSWEKLCTSLTIPPLPSLSSLLSRKNSCKKFLFKESYSSFPDFQRETFTPSHPPEEKRTFLEMERRRTTILVLIPSFCFFAVQGKMKAQLSPRFSWPMSDVFLKWSLSHDWFQGKKSV